MANIQEEWEKKWVDYYKLFGIQMNAIEEEIKKAYRKLIRNLEEHYYLLLIDL